MEEQLTPEELEYQKVAAEYSERFAAWQAAEPEEIDPVVIQPFSYQAVGMGIINHIEAKVHGFWSRPVTLYIRSDGRWTEQQRWSFSLSHSTGGTNGGDEEDCFAAEERFADALKQMVAIARDLRAHADNGTLDKYHAISHKAAMAEMARLHEKQMQSKRESEARYGADKPLGLDGAQRLIAAGVHAVKEKREAEPEHIRNYLRFTHDVDCKRRGDRQADGFTVVLSSGVVSFRMSGARISRSNLLKVLADEMSHVSLEQQEQAA